MGITWSPSVADSRLVGQWHVKVCRAHDLPKMDCFSETDAVVIVRIVNAMGEYGPIGYTDICYDDSNPEIQDRLDFAEVRPDLLASLKESTAATLPWLVGPSDGMEVETFEKCLETSIHFQD